MALRLNEGLGLALGTALTASYRKFLNVLLSVAIAKDGMKGRLRLKANKAAPAIISSAVPGSGILAAGVTVKFPLADAGAGPLPWALISIWLKLSTVRSAKVNPAVKPPIPFQNGVCDVCPQGVLLVSRINVEAEVAVPHVPTTLGVLATFRRSKVMPLQTTEKDANLLFGPSAES